MHQFGRGRSKLRNPSGKTQGTMCSELAVTQSTFSNRTFDSRWEGHQLSEFPRKLFPALPNRTRPSESTFFDIPLLSAVLSATWSLLPELDPDEAESDAARGIKM